jgi:hypothetical protein
MLETIPDPIFIGADGSRFDSTQHASLKASVDRKIYDATHLYDRLGLATDIAQQAKEINTGQNTTYQQFVGSAKNRELFMTIVVHGTMNSGKGDTGSMNTTR